MKKSEDVLSHRRIIQGDFHRSFLAPGTGNVESFSNRIDKAAADLIVATLSV